MTYFTKAWADDLKLDDGTIISSSKQLDAYMQQNGLAMSKDYSPSYWQNLQYRQSVNRRKELFAAFLYNYKRSIWNAKPKRIRFRSSTEL